MNFVNIICEHSRASIFKDKSLENTKGIKDLFYVCEPVPNEWILEIRQKFEAWEDAYYWYTYIVHTPAYKVR